LADVRKLEGAPGAYRLRAGNLRVLFEIDKANRVFVIDRISDRKDAYR